MIKVTIELISAISPTRNKILGIIEIANWGKIINGLSNYTVKLSKWEPKLNETWKASVVLHFDRVKRGPYDLLYLALQSCLGQRNGEQKSIEQLEKDIIASLPKVDQDGQ